MSDIRFLVRRYITDGWAVLPIPKGEKGPRKSDWVNTTFTEQDFEPDDNIGIRLGDHSNGLVDVDLDCSEAIRIAPMFIESGRVHGRASKPQSHYWFRSPGLKTVQFKDVDGTMLVELRSTGGQTVVPPSLHKSGEELYWESEREPGVMDPAALTQQGLWLATATLLSRHWPSGSRHVAAGLVAGFLAARGLDPIWIETIVRAAATAAGDNEVADRARYARDTAETFRANPTNKVAGGPKLAELIGEAVVKRLRQWYGVGQDSVIDEMNQRHFVVSIGKDVVIGDEQDGDVRFRLKRAMMDLYANQRVQTGTKKVGQGKDATTTPTFRSKFDLWFEHPKRREHRDVVFSPPPATIDPRDYNLWTGFAVEPAETSAGSEPFIAHIHDIVCSGVSQYSEYLLDLLAFTLQNPGTPSGIAVAIKGSQGTGKGEFIRGFGSLFGKHFKHVDKSEHIVGKFNATLSNCVVMFADEAVWAGDKRELGALKRLITEPTLDIERKGIDAYQEENHIHLFMATNENWVVPAGDFERRFFVLMISDARRQDTTYFTALHTQFYLGGGQQAFMRFLLDRPVTIDQIRHAPKTKELTKQHAFGMSPEDKWWKEFLAQEPDLWPREIASDDLFWGYIDWCDTHKMNRRLPKQMLLAFVCQNLQSLDGYERIRIRSYPRDSCGKMIPGSEKVQMRGLRVPDQNVCQHAFDVAKGIETVWDRDEIRNSSVDDSDSDERVPF